MLKKRDDYETHNHHNKTSCLSKPFFLQRKALLDMSHQWKKLLAFPSLKSSEALFLLYRPLRPLKSHSIHLLLMCKDQQGILLHQFLASRKSGIRFESRTSSFMPMVQNPLVTKKESRSRQSSRHSLHSTSSCAAYSSSIPRDKKKQEWEKGRRFAGSSKVHSSDSCPWEAKDHVLYLLRQLEALKVSHIQRSANRCADYLAKLGSDGREESFYLFNGDTWKKESRYMGRPRN